MSKVYALLVGINEYSEKSVPRQNNLAGCVNDVERFHDYLKHTYRSNLRAEMLTNSQATYDNIVKQFREHLGQAEAGDVAVFHYCGHGAHAKCAPEFEELNGFLSNGDIRDEGLVCFDSREPGRYDLADKELAVLISEVAQNNPHIAIIFDCCHSGSGTRAGAEAKSLRTRMTSQRREGRALETYIGGHYKRMRDADGSIRIPPGQHVVLAACQASQTAKEDDRTHGGIFTSSLIDVLKSSRGEINYAELLVSARTATRNRIATMNDLGDQVSDQDPRIEPIDGFDANLGFLGKEMLSKNRLHRVYFDQNNWNIELGALKGIPVDSDKPISVALHQEDEQASFVGEGIITLIGPATSRLKLKFKGDQTKDYRAKLTSKSIAPISIYFDGSPDKKNTLQKTVDQDMSIGVEFVGEEVGASYALIAEDNSWSLNHKEMGKALSGKEVGSLVSILRKLVNWERGIAVKKQSTEIDMSKVDFIFSQKLDDGTELSHNCEKMMFEYRQVGGRWKPIYGKLQVRNNTGNRINVLLLHYASDQDIIRCENVEIEPTQDNYITLWPSDPREAFWLNDGEQEAIERYKLIVSTEAIDDFLLVQKITKSKQIDRGSGLPPTEARMMTGVDWFVKDISIKIVRRSIQSATQFGDNDVELSDGKIKIKQHASIKGNVKLSAVTPANRGDGTTPDFIQAFEGNGISLLDLSETGARGDGNSAILELTGIENPDELKENPLEIELNVALADDETLLPVVFDGRHKLLAGDAYYEKGTAHISINRIPDANGVGDVVNERGLGSALKLYFFKTYLKKNVNKLRWVYFRPDGTFERNENLLADKVAEASNILLLVHGIIGDTEDIVAGIQACGLHDTFDLVLTFDYENLNTPIDKTAIDLKTRLAEVGVKDGNDKRLTILAHSMGGLVSRSFIERERGDKVVDHLVMCGTPNHGSPFGKIDDARKILNLLTVISMNFIPALVPFSSPFLMILNRTKKLTLCLEQMDPDSEFIQTLNDSDDPGVRYTILAGDINSYLEPTDEFFAKLLEKAGKSAAFDQLFADKPNDIAVGVESIKTIGNDRGTAPIFKPVACHHLNYFSSSSGQKELMSVDWFRP